MRVYVIFDPAGIWELGEPIHAQRAEAERIVADYGSRPTAFGPYSLRVVEYDVQGATHACQHGTTCVPDWTP